MASDAGFAGGGRGVMSPATHSGNPGANAEWEAGGESESAETCSAVRLER